LEFEKKLSEWRSGCQEKILMRKVVIDLQEIGSILGMSVDCGSTENIGKLKWKRK